MGIDGAMAEGTTLGQDIDVPVFGVICNSDGEDIEDDVQYRYGHLSIRKQTSYR